MTLDGVAKAIPFAAGALLAARGAAADEPLECVLDSDCSKGRCIDLVCVDGPPAKEAASAEPSPARPEAPARVAPAHSAAAPPAHTPTPPSPARASTPSPTPAPSTQAPSSSAGTYRWGAAPPAPRADTTTEPAASEPKKEWYGGILLASYAAPPIGLALTMQGDGNALPVLVSVFAAPVVHWLNHQSGKGWLALFMQPVFTGVGLLAVSGCRGNDCDRERIVGGSIGYATWVVLDVAALAYKPAKKPATAFSVGLLRAPSATGLEVSGAF
jgi:hypothetical protein